MRASTRKKIIELAAEGKSINEIAYTTRCSKSNIEKLLGDQVALAQRVVNADGSDIVPTATVDDLAETIAITRASYVRMCRRLPDIIDGVLDRVDERLRDIDLTPQALQAMMMTISIAQSKQAELVRAMRDLQAESTDAIDAAWTIVIEDD